MLCETAIGTLPVEPGTLPPTLASVKYHSLRVYHQIQKWLGVFCGLGLESQCRELTANHDRSVICSLEILGSRLLWLQAWMRYHVLLMQEAWDDRLYCLLRVKGCMC